MTMLILNQRLLCGTYLCWYAVHDQMRFRDRTRCNPTFGIALQTVKEVRQPTPRFLGCAIGQLGCVATDAVHQWVMITELSNA